MNISTFMALAFSLLTLFNFVCVIGLIAWIVKLLLSVPEGQVAVVERFGKYYKTLSPGLHVVLPVIERVRCVQSVCETILDIRDVIFVCKDEVSISISGTLFYKIVDPIKATYAIGDLRNSMAPLWRSRLKFELEGCYLSEICDSRVSYAAANAIAKVNYVVWDWGINLSRFVLDEVKMSDELHRAMERVRLARCEADSMVLEAKLEADKKVEEARAKANAITIESEAFRDSIVSVAKAKAEAIALSNDVDARNLLEVLRIWAQMNVNEDSHSTKDEEMRHE